MTTERHCLTCKYEPAWFKGGPWGMKYTPPHDEQLIGIQTFGCKLCEACKEKIPSAFMIGHLRAYKSIPDNRAHVVTFRVREDGYVVEDYITNCPAWEPKMQLKIARRVIPF